MKIWITIPIILLLTGCMSSPTIQPSVGSSNPNQPPSGTTGSGSAATPIQLTNGPLSVTIYTPEQNATVTEATVSIQGSVSEETVLTINTDIYTLSPGNFTQTVSLGEGLNALQIVASDFSGNEVDLILSVTYQP
jgi:hypothetical protein